MRKTIYLLFFIIFLLLPDSVYAACDGSTSGSSPNLTAYDCSYDCVNLAVNTDAVAGDTVNIPAGGATWSSKLYITKGITLQGAGIDLTTITSNISDTGSCIITIIPDATSISADATFRVTGFTFDGDWKSGGLRVAQTAELDTAPANIRIDHNKFFECNSRGVQFGEGVVYGLVDNNQFIDCLKSVDSYGVYWYTWDRHPLTLGAVTSVYIEDNIITITEGSSALGITSGGHGGRYVFRYNTISMPSYYMALWDIHGNNGAVVDYGACPDCATGTSSCCLNNRGAIVGEIYRNTITVKRNTRSLDLRGGTGIVFDNVITSTPSTYTLTLVMREEDAPYDHNIRSAWPAYDQVKDTYIWNNTNNGTEIVPRCYNADPTTGDALFIQLNRDYWNYNSSFDGTSGMGVGTLANIPGTCTAGVGYWAIDQGSWNVLGDDGVLYKCTSTNNWEIYYTPYTYPHPLRDDGCGDGVCGAGECISGCTDDCSVENCCGIEGCNVAIGETIGNCPGDCSEDPPPVESGAPGLSSVGYQGVSIN